jgi:hypothetical protein
MRPTVFGFPNPVNEVAARTVAASVVTMAGVAVGTRQLWITILLAYGFAARTLTGPRLSPLGFAAPASSRPGSRAGINPCPVRRNGLPRQWARRSR